MKIIRKIISAIMGFFAKTAVFFGGIFNKDDASSNPAGRGTMNEARPRRRLVDGVDADRFTRLCVFMVIGFVSLLGAVLIAVSVRSGGHQIPVDPQEGQESRPSGTFTLSLGGNIMPTQDMLDSSAADGQYDFRSGLSELSEPLAGDLTVVGLCGQVNAYDENARLGGIDKGKNYPSSLAANLSELGVNYIFGANQYTLANGYDGMCGTITNLHVNSLGVIGMTDGDPGTLNTSVVKRNGINVGLAGYNCMEDGGYAKLSADQKGHIATVSKDALAERAATDIAKLRKKGAEFIVICVNWGGLDTFSTSDYMKQTAKEIAEAGADVIVGYGPCVTLDVDVLSVKSGESEKECFVFYSLGCVYGNNTYTGNPSVMGLKGKLSADQKKALENEKKRVTDSKALMSRSMTVSLNVKRGGDGTVTVEKAVYNPIYMIRNPGQGEENTHMKYMSVPCVKYVDAEVRPDIFTEDKQWEACKAAFRVICAIGDRTGGRLVLNDFGHADGQSDVSDGKI